MRDKAIAEISGILFPLARQVIVTAPQQARALSPDAIRGIVEHPNVRAVRALRDALTLVEDAGPDEAIFITGSLFLVAEARAALKPEGVGRKIG
jgi:folylpolyglutamate synthase/dihydropteroate synthase